MKFFAMVFALLIAACKPVSAPFAGADPADPSAPVPAARYQSSLGGTAGQRPVEPLPWREQNQRAVPQPER
jgi:hypothetical protein